MTGFLLQSIYTRLRTLVGQTSIAASPTNLRMTHVAEGLQWDCGPQAVHKLRALHPYVNCGRYTSSYQSSIECSLVTSGFGHRIAICVCCILVYSQVLLLVWTCTVLCSATVALSRLMHVCFKGSHQEDLTSTNYLQPVPNLTCAVMPEAY